MLEVEEVRRILDKGKYDPYVVRLLADAAEVDGMPEVALALKDMILYNRRPFRQWREWSNGWCWAWFNDGEILPRPACHHVYFMPMPTEWHNSPLGLRDEYGRVRYFQRIFELIAAHPACGSKTLAISGEAGFKSRTDAFLAYAEAVVKVGKEKPPAISPSSPPS